MAYLSSKGLGGRGHPRKTEAETYLTRRQWQAILAACEATKDHNKRWKRDYTAIYLGFCLGLRVGEVCLLQRRHFAELGGTDNVHIPTLKQSERVPVVCSGTYRNAPCARKARVRADRIGQSWQCPRCGAETKVPKPRWVPKTGVVEKDPPIVEEQVIAYLQDFMANHMRPDQTWLFEGRAKGEHLSISQFERIFSTYAAAAGVSAKTSWHALRHGRGVQLWSMSQDLVLVAGGLRHGDIKSAQKYVGLDPEKRASYKKKLEQGAFDPLESEDDKL